VRTRCHAVAVIAEQWHAATLTYEPPSRDPVGNAPCPPPHCDPSRRCVGVFASHGSG
jgi:hypothetical protein